MFWSKSKIIRQTRQTILAELEQERLERETRKKEVEVLELSEHLGKLVICVSNEMDNVTVGYGKEVVFITRAQQPRLLVHDLVRNRDILPLGVLFAYTEQKFDALNNMDHNARISILYNRLDDHHVCKEATKSENLYEPFEWDLKVKTAVAAWQAAQVTSDVNSALSL